MRAVCIYAINKVHYLIGRTYEPQLHAAVCCVFANREVKKWILLCLLCFRVDILYKQIVLTQLCIFFGPILSLMRLFVILCILIIGDKNYFFVYFCLLAFIN